MLSYGGIIPLFPAACKLILRHTTPQHNAYEEGPDIIRIRFTSGSVYLYTYESTYEEDIEEMKELARKGEGLTRFINEVQPGYTM